MVATAATAAIAQCFSASIAPSTQPKITSDHFALRLSGQRTHRSIAALIISTGFAIVPRRRGVPKISAAVAQEDTTESVIEEEEKEEKAESSADVDDAPAAPPPPVNTKLYFGNLPYSCDSAQLAGIIQEYASPEMIEVLYDRATGRSRGFAFVTMSSVEDCESVIQNLDGCQYGGRMLRVNFSDKPKKKEPLYPETEFKLFVGNLSWSLTSESLGEVFQECGEVVGARVLYDGETGQSRGYGFVSYSSKEEMDAAMEKLDGVEIDGRAIRISLAEGRRS